MKIVECPRDAMQGINKFIPTKLKIAYINQLLKVGFHTIDFGSFVSPKSVPQMKDTSLVLDKLSLEDSSSKLLSIVANLRGGEEACKFEEIAFLGFPLSLSETFQKRNTNKSIEEAFKVIDDLQKLIANTKKQLVVYLSMGFGNPYGDPYHPELILQFTEKLIEAGVSVISLADTIGSSTPELISSLFTQLIPFFPGIEFGAHLHTSSNDAMEKLKASYESGCRRIDGALLGYGGCPMADDVLIGNMPTEKIVELYKSNLVGFDNQQFNNSIVFANNIFRSI